MPLTVGFDLDMTLVDARAGMAEAFDILAAETGIPLDGAAFAGRLGPPLQSEFARYGLAEEVIADLIRRYRQLYPTVILPQTVALPGAREALAAVAAHGGTSIVVTAKLTVNAQASLDALGLAVAQVVGDVWSVAKADALRAAGAGIYVGDHLGDIAGAHAAGALAVTVATGPISAEDLRAAGADVVLADLTRFPRWLDDHLSALRR